MNPRHWLEEWTLRRIRARAAIDLLARHYEAATTSYRTQGWRQMSRSGDPNAAVNSGRGRLRDAARDTIRNSAYAENAVATIVDHAVGTGIVAKPYDSIAGGQRTEVAALWKRWAETTACDADGRLDLAGLQKL